MLPKLPVVSKIILALYIVIVICLRIFQEDSAYGGHFNDEQNRYFLEICFLIFSGGLLPLVRSIFCGIWLVTAE